MELELLRLSTDEPTPDNIDNFEFLSRQLRKNFNNHNSDDFKNAVNNFINIYDGDSISSPVWKLLSAHNIFLMYESRIPGNVFSLSNPDMIECMKWAEIVAKFPTTNDDFDIEKNLAKMWLSKIRRRRQIDQLILDRIDHLDKLFKNEINDTHDHLLSLVKHCLAQEDINANKTGEFSRLKVILEDTREESKLKRILLFNTKLNAESPATPEIPQNNTWSEFFNNASSLIYNLLKCLTIEPIITSYYKYGSCQFWKPENQRAKECAKENLAGLFDILSTRAPL